MDGKVVRVREIETVLTALPVRVDHAARTEAIFKDLRLRQRPDDDPWIFVRVEQINYSNVEVGVAESVELSVFSKKIYEYDKETILAERDDLSIKNYRPFFVSILIPIDDKKKLLFFTELRDRWMPAVIDLRDKEIPGDERRNVFDATLVCSASPFQIDRFRLRIVTGMGPFLFNGKDINDLVKKDYDASIMNNCVADDDDIESELNAAWSPSGYDYIDIYNVGHGNADYIVGGRRRILYDIGYQYRKLPSLTASLFPKATRSFAALRPSLVIISHWDSDHFMGCVYLDDAAFDVKWIAPTLTSASDKTFSLNSFRLAAFLKATGKLMLIDRTKIVFYNTDISADNWLLLKMGISHKPETRNITTRNREGLFIEIYENKCVETLLAGDVPYNSLWGSAFTSAGFHFMHVPHHCSEMILDQLAASTWSGNNRHAVISTDRAGTGYNENAGHRQELDNKFGKNVHYTIGDLSRTPDDIRALRLCRGGSVLERT